MAGLPSPRGWRDARRRGRCWPQRGAGGGRRRGCGGCVARTRREVHGASACAWRLGGASRGRPPGRGTPGSCGPCRSACAPACSAAEASESHPLRLQGTCTVINAGAALSEELERSPSPAVAWHAQRAHAQGAPGHG